MRTASPVSSLFVHRWKGKRRRTLARRRQGCAQPHFRPSTRLYASSTVFKSEVTEKVFEGCHGNIKDSLLPVVLLLKKLEIN